MRYYRLIERQYDFLTKSGFIYQHINNKTYDICRFQKSTTTISLSYDFHEDYLDFLVKEGTTTIIETQYSSLLKSDKLVLPIDFEVKLKTIYKYSHTSISLSELQFIDLIRLYQSFIEYYLYFYSKRH